MDRCDDYVQFEFFVIFRQNVFFLTRASSKPTYNPYSLTISLHFHIFTVFTISLYESRHFPIVGMRANPGVSIPNVSSGCRVEPNRNCWQMSNNKCIAGDACACTAVMLHRRSDFIGKRNLRNVLFERSLLVILYLIKKCYTVQNVIFVDSTNKPLGFTPWCIIAIFFQLNLWNKGSELKKNVDYNSVRKIKISLFSDIGTS